MLLNWLVLLLLFVEHNMWTLSRKSFTFKCWKHFHMYSCPKFQGSQHVFVHLFDSCMYDYLELRDGSTSNNNIISRLCGNTRPSTQHSTGSSMWLRFRTDASITHQGFKAKYSIGTESSWSCSLKLMTVSVLPSLMSRMEVVNQ